MQLMHHPNVMRLLEYYSTILYNVAISVIVMPLARYSVQDLIDNKAAMNPKGCAADIMNALDHVHKQGYVHLDVTTMNILVNKDGVYILTDFGVSRRIGTACVANSVTNEACRAPELHEDFVALPQADTWALACVVTEMMEQAGFVPYMFHTGITGSLAHKIALAATFVLHCDGTDANCACHRLCDGQFTTSIWKDKGLYLMVSHCWQINPMTRCSASHALRLLHAS